MLRILIPLAALLLLGLVVTRALRRNRPSASSAGRSPGRTEAESAFARAARLAVLWRCGGVLAGAAVAVRLAYAPPSWLGLGLAFVAPAFALFVLAGVLAGEALRYSHPGRLRSAPIATRSARGFLPPVATRWALGLTGALAILLIGTTAAGSPDRLGRAGRSLVVACGDAAGGVATHGPWPGTYYSVPMALLVVVGLLATGGVLHRIVRRPLPDGELGAADAELRRRSARIVVAAAGLLVAVTLTGTAYFAGAAMVAVGCGPGWLAPLGWATLVLAVAGFVSSAAFTSVLLIPGRLRGGSVPTLAGQGGGPR